MKKKNMLAFAAFSALLFTVGCKCKNNEADDSARAAMADTATMAPAQVPPATNDTVAAGTAGTAGAIGTAGSMGTTDTTKTGTYGDTIKR